MKAKDEVSMKNTWFVLLISSVLVLLFGCGGGANDERPGAVLLNITEFSGFYEVPMVVGVDNQTVDFSIEAGATRSGLDPTVATVELNSLDVTFTRTSGSGANLRPFSIPLGQRVGSADALDGVPSDVEYTGITILTIDELLFSPFAVEFYSKLNSGNLNEAGAEFNATITVTGQNLAGDSVRDSFSFPIRLDFFANTSDFTPSILSFNYFNALRYGEDMLLTWSTESPQFPLIGGELLLPWGRTVTLGPNDFPVGSITVPTEPELDDRVAPGTSVVFPAPSLRVFNNFQSATENGNDEVVITRASDPTVSLPEVTIDRFSADRSTIVEGEEVRLSWSVSGGADKLEIFPNSFGGEEVSFEGKDPAFDFITIKPDFSVRPILRATRSSDGFVVEQALSEALTVTPPAAVEPEDPPVIDYFIAANPIVPSGSQTVLFWNVSGQYSKLELFPVNTEKVDVTDRDFFLTPPLNLEGPITFNLVAFPVETNASPVISSVSINVSDSTNQNITIGLASQQPSSSIANGDSGAFTFNIVDPEGQPSSWRCQRIAGDQATFIPQAGKIPNGNGQGVVSFDDGQERADGYVVFQVTAYDDDFFGGSFQTTSSILLVTYTTDGQLSDNAPTITDLTFTPGNEASTEGVISFRIDDPDTLRLRWTVSIQSGDFGGTIDPAGGTITTGGGQIYARYVDDPDTPDADVVFVVRAVEQGVSNPQQAVAVLSVDKGSATVIDANAPITVPFDDLYSNVSGTIATADFINDYTLYIDGMPNNPQFYRNSDLSGPVNGVSAIFDFAHNTSNPGAINGVIYTRDFISSATGNDNNSGSLVFRNYYSVAGSSSGGTSTPPQGGVSRWYMPFSVEDFSPSNGTTYNLPATGSADYQMTITVVDNIDGVLNVNRTLSVRVP